MKKQFLALAVIGIIAISSVQVFGLTYGPEGGPHLSQYTTKAAPNVLTTDPLDKAKDVSLDKVITVTFSEPLDAMSINASTFVVKQGDKDVKGKVEYSGSIAMFTPAVSLVAGSVYTVTVTTGVKNPKGEALAADFVFSFTTVGAPAVAGK